MRLRTRTLGALVLAVTLLLAGCTAPLQTSSDPAADASSTDSASATGPTVSTTGTGEVTVAPDLAVVSVSVVATADTADAARSQAAQRSNDLVAALKKAGVAEDSIETSYYSLQPQYDYSGQAGKSPRVVGYRAVHAYTVEVSPDHAGDVVDAAVGAAGTTVNGVQFTLTDETRADLRAKALAAAVKNARADADAVANASDVSISGVHSISTASAGTPVPVQYGAEKTAASGSTSTNFQPGPVTVTATVSVTYDVQQ